MRQWVLFSTKHTHTSLFQGHARMRAFPVACVLTCTTYVVQYSALHSHSQDLAAAGRAVDLCGPVPAVVDRDGRAALLRHRRAPRPADDRPEQRLGGAAALLHRSLRRGMICWWSRWNRERSGGAHYTKPAASALLKRLFIEYYSRVKHWTYYSAE